MTITNYACQHGSLWCGRCRHNVAMLVYDREAGHLALFGRPKYEPSRGAHKRGVKGKKRVRRGPIRL